MKILNVGALEVLFIVLLAFILLGPKRAVETAGNLGRWLKKFTKSQFWKDLVATSKDIQEFPRKVMDEVELQETLEELERSSSQVNSILRSSEPIVVDDVGQMDKDDREHKLTSGLSGKEDS